MRGDVAAELVVRQRELRRVVDRYPVGCGEAVECREERKEGRSEGFGCVLPAYL